MPHYILSIPASAQMQPGLAICNALQPGFVQSQILPCGVYSARLAFERPCKAIRPEDLACPSKQWHEVLSSRVFNWQCFVLGLLSSAAWRASLSGQALG